MEMPFHLGHLDQQLIKWGDKMSKNVKYKVNADKVLIIPGYTDEEILKQNKKDKKNKSKK